MKKCFIAPSRAGMSNAGVEMVKYLDSINFNMRTQDTREDYA